MRDVWDKFWRDDRGNVVIWQFPNLWLIAWAGLTFISLLFSGNTADVFTWAASAALIVWSILEVLKGVNGFRRALGLVVLIYAVMTLLKSF